MNRRPLAYRVFQVGYVLLAANFIMPAASYIVAPQLALGTLDRINVLLGGGHLPPGPGGELWHMLAVGNVMTLGFLCLLILIDLERYYPALPALAFLKAFSAFYSLQLGLSLHLPAFEGIFVLDGTTTIALVALAVAAHRGLHPDDVAPLWSYLVLWQPERVQRGLRLRASARPSEPRPNLWQIFLGVLAMWHRVLFRMDTVGTNAAPVRDTWRARLLQYRGLRLPFLLWERAVAPLDFSGLASSPERTIRHVLGANHQPAQLAYDMELLAVCPGKLEALRDAAQAIIDGRAPNAAWLRDLCVFEGYHEDVLDAATRALRGDLRLSRAQAEDPDIALLAHLRWCAAQPSTPHATWRAWRQGQFTLRREATAPAGLTA
ncbi:MAG: hypothetical protein JST54_14585 [Deltaproteobacteria bacterium]|nr:hypothetical protein [Deltaproteobacteria bacterium]